MRHLSKAATAAVVLTLAAAPCAHAGEQWGALLNAIVQPPAPAPDGTSKSAGGPVGLTSGIAAGSSPDAYLAETIETTQILMVATAILAQASRNDMEMSGLEARIAEINSVQRVGELNTMQASFTSDYEALKTNEQSSEALRTAYQNGDERQRQLLGAAAFNLLWASFRVANLVAQTDDLIATVRAQPMLMLTQGRSLLDAGMLMGRNAPKLVEIIGHARIIMREEGSEEPREADGRGARVIEL